MIPVTFQHPEERRVTVDNNRRLNVGITGENVSHDDQFVSVAVKIMDKAVVAYVLERHDQGKDVELSCGYEAEVLPIAGEHATEGHYDAVQKNIRYNHLSIVPMGRAGHNVKLKLDAKPKEQTMFNFIRSAIKDRRLSHGCHRGRSAERGAKHFVPPVGQAGRGRGSDPATGPLRSWS